MISMSCRIMNVGLDNESITNNILSEIKTIIDLMRE